MCYLICERSLRGAQYCSTAFRGSRLFNDFIVWETPHSVQFLESTYSLKPSEAARFRFVFFQWNCLLTKNLLWLLWTLTINTLNRLNKQIESNLHCTIVVAHHSSVIKHKYFLNRKRSVQRQNRTNFRYSLIMWLKFSATIPYFGNLLEWWTILGIKVIKI